MTQPYIFDEFFASGRDETISPFLTPDSRKWGRNLPLKSALLAAFLLLLSFILYFINLPASHLALTGVYFLVGTPALLSSLEDLKNFTVNIDVLMTIAALLSVLIGSGLEGALLLVLFEFSGAMENTVTKKTKSALLTLQQLSPKTALLLQPDGTLLERSVREITTGESILVRAGQVVPLDGTVVAGSSYVNLIHLTGESQPIAKHLGDTVQAGAHNLDGSLTLRVERSTRDSTLARIINLITEAQEAKPKLQRLFDRFGKWYSITIILLSIFFALTLPFVFSLPYLGIEGSIYRALTFLIAASPCALIIATPTAYLSAISSCARSGILLKGGAVLDALTTCSTIAFDKTGTLTTGKLRCTKITPLHSSHENPLGIAAGLEKHSTHPIGEAITNLAKEQNVPPAPIKDFESVSGYGLKGFIEDGTPVRIGHPDFIEHPLPENLQGTLLQIGKAVYLLQFSDEIRPESIASIPTLKIHKKLVLLTGDHTENAAIVAQSLGIDAVYSDLRPEDKLDKVAELSKDQGLIMVGDGINDAPALARATVGISMGKIGSHAAIDASDVVFLQDDLSLLETLLKKSDKTMQIIRQNLTLALGVICLATTPALLGYIPLWLAVILHEGGTVIVGLNSLRLLSKKN